MPSLTSNTRDNTILQTTFRDEVLHDASKLRQRWCFYAKSFSKITARLTPKWSKLSHSCFPFNKYLLHLDHGAVHRATLLQETSPREEEKKGTVEISSSNEMNPNSGTEVGATHWVRFTYASGGNAPFT